MQNPMANDIALLEAVEMFLGSDEESTTSVSSPSSSSDDEEMIVLAAVVHTTQEREQLHKVNDFVGTTVSEYTDTEFKKHFRMSRNSCAKLSDEFQTSVFCPKTDHSGGRPRIPTEDYVLVFLWYAGNKTSIRLVANLFGISEWSVFRILNIFLNFLVDSAPKYIYFPKTTEEKEKSAKKFQTGAKFPNVIGCVDGSYISLTTPAKQIRSTYTNRHDQISMTLQGICDADKRFLDVFTCAWQSSRFPNLQNVTNFETTATHL